jgi:23S rRNA (cytosine1962-C5)-methyltransferase
MSRPLGAPPNPDSTRPPARLRLRISPTAEKHLRAGHPWVYSDSVREQNRPGTAGELAVIFDRNDKFFAVGFFDPDSPIRVRVLHVGKPVPVDRDFWNARLDATLQRRAGLFDDQTTGYRLINGESDGWPGLVLDRYDTTLVLKIYTAAWWNWLGEITSLIHARLQPEQIILRTSRNVQRPPNSPGDGTALLHQNPTVPDQTPVIFRETGIRFEADVWRGQKTGFFLDQRENRRQVATLASGRTVLNAFSFSGGFSLYAARGGAKSVTDLDISAHALASADRNFALNAADPKIAQCRHESIQADVFEWLAHNSGRTFDLIILDPPSLAKRETERPGAIRAYGRLTESALPHLAPGGILVACSCSAHVSAVEFFTAVRTTTRSSGRRFTELQTTHHAPDHAATFAEAEYLKGIYLRCGAA